MLSFKFSRKYFIAALILFIIEIGIALFVNDQFIRPYLGDYLVVIFIYCFLKSFWNAPPLTVALSVLIFSFLVEILQYFEFIKILGLGNSTLAKIIIGTTFHWADLVAYLAGILTVLGIEYYRRI